MTKTKARPPLPPRLRRLLEELARQEARSGLCTEAEAREALGLESESPPTTPAGKTGRPRGTGRAPEGWL